MFRPCTAGVANVDLWSAGDQLMTDWVAVDNQEAHLSPFDQPQLVGGETQVVDVDPHSHFARTQRRAATLTCRTVRPTRIRRRRRRRSRRRDRHHPTPPASRGLFRRHVRCHGVTSIDVRRRRINSHSGHQNQRAGDDARVNGPTWDSIAGGADRHRFGLGNARVGDGSLPACVDTARS